MIYGKKLTGIYIGKKKYKENIIINIKKFVNYVRFSYLLLIKYS